MLECYVAKFNVEPTTLELYDEKNLIENVIPSSLDKIFKHVQKSDNIIEYEKKNDIQSVLESELYKIMLEHKQQLITDFNHVVEQFNRTREIIYSEDYMQKRLRLKSVLEELFETYPFLKNSEKTRIKSFSKGKIPEIRMGVTYIDRASKIEKFLEISAVANRELRFFYDCSKEWIYIPSSCIVEKSTMSELQSIVEEIQLEVNRFKNTTNIGNVSINLVYDNFSIKKGNYKEITIIRVYPNGNPSRDRQRAMKAAREEIKLTAAEDATFSNEQIENETKDDAQKGYIATIRSKTRNIIENRIRKVRIPFMRD